MIRKLLFIALPLLVFAFFNLMAPAQADQADWTEKKLGQVILKADRAARRQNWARAIKYGEQMLLGVQVLNQKSDARYIHLLKNLNRYYDKAGRLTEIGPRVAAAYRLSKAHLGLTHDTTMMSRHLYYKLLLAERKYRDAIPLVQENIDIARRSQKDPFRQLHFLEQLATLYGLTKQLEKEEKALLHFLEASRKILDATDKEHMDIILMLAQNYCRRQETEKFKKLAVQHHLKYFCK